MKLLKLIICQTLCLFLACISYVHAQSPDKLSYQAVIRDNNNQLITNSSIGMRISILQGSEFGASVFVETHTPVSNTNGLVSLQIGTGTAVLGNFADIDWSNGPYFIKSEADPEGGTNYNIVGVTELLSVPYSMHTQHAEYAKHATTAETVLGGINETDPVFNGSPAKDITSDDIAKLSNLSGTNTGDQDLSKLATKKELNDLEDDLPRTYKVGDRAFGGIVFYVDHSGQHGLVCALEDLPIKLPWTVEGFENMQTHAVAKAMNAGLGNTLLMLGPIRNSFEKKTAATAAYNMPSKSSGPWYLPSYYEMDEIRKERDKINDVLVLGSGERLKEDDRYWTSSESTQTHLNAHYVRMNDDDPLFQSIEKDRFYFVRPVKAF